MVRHLILLFIFICLATKFRADSTDSLAFFQGQGIEHYNKGQLKEAEASFLRAEKIAAGNNSAIHVEILNNLGNITGYLGKSEESINWYQQALRKVNTSKFPKEFEAKILKNIGATYSDLKDFSLGLSYLLKAEIISREINNAELIADCLNNRGIIYEQTDSLDLALLSYSQALDYYRKLSNPDRMALIFINIGVLEKQMANWESAKLAYDSALYYSRILGNEFYIAACLNNLGNVLSGMKRFDEAVAMTNEALSIARKIQHPDLEQNCLSSLAEQFHAMGNDKNAFLYQSQFLALHDSIINIERVDALSEMETKYEVEKKELQLGRLTAENKLKEEENKRSKLYMIFLASGLFLVIAGAIVTIRLRAMRQKRDELQLVANAEKQERERIAKDMHDELGSGISRITWITATAERQVKDNELKIQLGNIENIAEQLAVGMKSLIWLLNSGNCEWSVLSGRVREMSSQICEDFQIELNFEDQLKQTKLNTRQNAARDILLLCKEAVNNAAKYSETKKLEMSFEKSISELVLRIRDYGVGFNQEEVRIGHGLVNIRRRVADLNGVADLITANGNGCEWVIKFPLNQIVA